MQFVQSAIATETTETVIEDEARQSGKAELRSQLRTACGVCRRAQEWQQRRTGMSANYFFVI